MTDQMAAETNDADLRGSPLVPPVGVSSTESATKCRESVELVTSASAATDDTSNTVKVDVASSLRVLSESPSNSSNSQSSRAIGECHVRDDTKLLRRGPWWMNKFTWCLFVATGLWLAVTIVHAWALAVTNGPLTKLIPISESATINCSSNSL